jgi:ABC-type oligopeptide transport system substrate-binding subunit
MRLRSLMAVILMVASLSLVACSSAESSEENTEETQAKVEDISGTDVKRVTLTSTGAQRLGIQTTPVSEMPFAGGTYKVIPYAALLYDPEGATWAYTSPESLVFVRQPVDVNQIQGDVVVLSNGPPTGTQVVTTGVAELYGTEVGVAE